MGMQLDDILGGLSGCMARERGKEREGERERERERESKRAKKDISGEKSRAKAVSALELLIGLDGECSSAGKSNGGVGSSKDHGSGSDTNKRNRLSSGSGKDGNTSKRAIDLSSSNTLDGHNPKSSSAKSSTTSSDASKSSRSSTSSSDKAPNKRKLGSNLSTSPALTEADRGRRESRHASTTVADAQEEQQSQLQADRTYTHTAASASISSIQLGAESKSATSIPADLSRSLPIASSSSTPSSPALASSTLPTKRDSSNANPTLDAPHLLKSLRSHLRDLVATLAKLRGELTLVERLWYKNGWQFRGALWWAAFDGVRRGMRRLLVPKEMQRERVVGGDKALADGCMADLFRLYAGLGGGEATLVRAPDNGIVKFDVKPTGDVVRSFLASSVGAAHVQTTLVQIETVQAVLRVLHTRCRQAGKWLVRHLNTPPAPTFGALVSALLALVAALDAELGTMSEVVRRVKAVLDSVLGR